MQLTWGRYARIWLAFAWKSYLGTSIASAYYYFYRLTYPSDHSANLVAIPTVIFCVLVVGLSLYFTLRKTYSEFKTVLVPRPVKLKAA